MQVISTLTFAIQSNRWRLNHPFVFTVKYLCPGMTCLVGTSPCMFSFSEREASSMPHSPSSQYINGQTEKLKGASVPQPIINREVGSEVDAKVLNAGVTSHICHTYLPNLPYCLLCTTSKGCYCYTSTEHMSQ